MNAEERGFPRSSEPVLPESRHVLAGAIRLHYLDWPDHGGTPILFLHGGHLTAHTWDPVCLALHDRFRCLAVDLRGHGDSEWSLDLDYSIDAHARDVEALVATLGLDDFVLVGTSFGGSVAMAYAARHSGRLRGLVVVDVCPRLRPEGIERVRRFALGPHELPSVEDFVQRMIDYEPRRDAELLRTSLLHELRQLPDGAWTWKYDRRHLGSKTFYAAMDRSRTALEQRIPAIACPALVLHGAESDAVLEEDAQALAASMQRARALTVPAAGHAVEGDNPGDVAAAIESFVESLDARR